MIEIADLSHSFASRVVLDVPRWSVGKGQAGLVLGQSGSGKSTLLYCLTGLLTPTSGTIKVAGTVLSSLSAAQQDRFRGRTFGIVFQSMRLISSLTVMQNLALARSLAGKPAHPDLAGALLDQLGIGRLAQVKPRALSVGEAQRAAIARAAISEPAVLVADEPTSALDDTNAAAVAQLLRETAARIDATMIIATHDHRLTGLFDHRLDLGGPKP